jgi:hypothetical protein
MSTTYNCPHTLVHIWGRFFFKNMIHIAHPMCLVLFPLLHSTHVNGYKFGDTQIEDELQLPQTCFYCKVYIRTTHIKHEPYKKTLNQIRKKKIKWVGMKAYCL